jgi:hypothetical protein
MAVYKSNGIEIRDSVEGDIALLKDKLRVADVAEIWASHHFMPEQALKAGFEVSMPCWTAFYKGEAIAMFGLNKDVLNGDGKTGIIWLLGTERINRIEKSFIKASKVMVSWILSFCPALINMVHNRNTASINWLKSLGATFDESEIILADGTFYKFEIRRG